MNQTSETALIRHPQSGRAVKRTTQRIPASSARSEIEMQLVMTMLSGMHRDPGLLQDVFDICPATHFVTNEASELAEALDLLRKSGEQAGLTQLACQMRARWAQDPERYPRPDLARLAEMAGTHIGLRGHAIHYARRLADEHARAELHSGLLEIAADASVAGVEPGEIADRARKLAECFGVVRTTADMDGLMSRILTRLGNPEQVQCVPSPWANLNRLLRGGFMPGELVVIAARPGLGKTALAGCIAVETARRGSGVLFVSCEMSDEALGSRFLAREGRVDNRFFREGVEQVNVAMPKLSAAAERLAALPLSVAERSTIPMCPREVRRLARGIDHIGLVVVDYLQLLHPDEKSTSREREIAEMSRAFKQLAIDMKIPVIVLSQLNRQQEQADREPRVSDLRESGAIEQDADIVLLLHTRNSERTSPNPEVQCIVGKSRSTQTGSVYLRFEKAFSDFAETIHREPVKGVHNDNGL